jgi:Cu/Ag efflux protein CusF
MKKLMIIFLAAALMAAFNSGAIAKKAEKPGAITVEVIEWTATVKSIDYVAKTAVLVDENGKEITVNAKNARNLDQVIVGDKVKVKYIEELAIFVRKSKAPAFSGTLKTVALAPKGAMPGGVIAETVQIIANVIDVNYKERTITLQNSAGEIHTYKIGKEVKRFKQIKKGDQVVVNATQALALEVVKK